MTVSVRLNDKDVELFKRYAEMNNLSISDLIRISVLEKIEDEYDLQCYENAMAEYQKDQTTYTIDEVKKELGI